MRPRELRSVRRAARLSYELARLRVAALRAAAGTAVFVFCEQYTFGASHLSHAGVFFTVCALLDWWGYPSRLVQRVVSG